MFYQFMSTIENQNLLGKMYIEGALMSKCPNFALNKLSFLFVNISVSQSPVSYYITCAAEFVNCNFKVKKSLHSCESFVPQMCHFGFYSFWPL